MNRLPWIALLAWTVAAQAAEPLGRLFFTPQQRAALDAARRQKVPVKVESDSDSEPAAQPAAPRALTVNGYIRSSGGKATLWVNGKAVADDAPENVLGGRVEKDGRVSIRTLPEGPPVRLKVGQQFDPGSGQVRESYASPPRAQIESSAAAPSSPQPAPARPPATSPERR